MNITKIEETFNKSAKHIFSRRFGDSLNVSNNKNKKLNKGEQ